MKTEGERESFWYKMTWGGNLEFVEFVCLLFVLIQTEKTRMI